jgi:hypothetical protein
MIYWHDSAGGASKDVFIFSLHSIWAALSYFLAKFVNCCCHLFTSEDHLHKYRFKSKELLFALNSL